MQTETQKKTQGFIAIPNFAPKHYLTCIAPTAVRKQRPRDVVFCLHLLRASELPGAAADRR